MAPAHWPSSFPPPSPAGAHAGDLQARAFAAGYSLGRFRNDLLERFHRVCKNVKSDNGASAARSTLLPCEQDRLCFFQQFFSQWVKIYLALNPGIAPHDGTRTTHVPLSAAAHLLVQQLVERRDHFPKGAELQRLCEEAGEPADRLRHLYHNMMTAAKHRDAPPQPEGPPPPPPPHAPPPHVAGYARPAGAAAAVAAAGAELPAAARSTFRGAQPHVGGADPRTWGAGELKAYLATHPNSGGVEGAKQLLVERVKDCMVKAWHGQVPAGGVPDFLEAAHERSVAVAAVDAPALRRAEKRERRAHERAAAAQKAGGTIQEAGVTISDSESGDSDSEGGDAPLHHRARHL